MIYAGILKHTKHVGCSLLTLSSLLGVLPWQTAQATSHDYVEFSDEEERAVTDDDILRESHSLLTLVEDNFSFIKQHPTLFMTAAQTIYAMILEQGKEDLTIPGYGQVSVYNFFSKANKVTGGRRIFGHYEGIEKVVQGIVSQAKNEKTGVKVPLLVGTHGTGKTEFRETIANGLRYQTTNNKTFYFYEIAWDVSQCRKIPSLYNYLKTRQNDDLRSALHSSPLALLPQRYQTKVAELGKAIMQEMIGIDDVVPMDLDPISKDIRDKIMMYFIGEYKDAFAAEVLDELKIVDKNGVYTDLDKIKILSKFAHMKRVVLGEPGTVPRISAQGDEIDYAGLFIGENPIFRMLDESTNPWSWNLGAIPRASKTMCYVDELYRNPPDFLNIMLDVCESRVLALKGAPTIPLDMVMIAASNSASVDHVRADKKAGAGIDRMLVIPFDWNINPHEIAMILLYMNGKQMQMKQLDTSSPNVEEASAEETDYHPMDIDKLFPRGRSNEQGLTPDGRYALLSGRSESDGVLVSPHTLMLMADFIATTRISTDTKAAVAVSGGEQIINDPLFRDPITRIKALKGEVHYQHSDLKALYNISLNLKEGSFGLSARDAGVWFAQALCDARKTGNDMTLSPVVLRRTYERLVNTGTIQVPDQPTKLKWKNLMDEVVKGILIPQLRQDIYSSFHNDGKAEDIYNEVVAEITALSQDTNASEYERDGHMQTVNTKRLADIKSIYQKKTGTVLSYQHIASFYLMQLSKPNKKITRDENLMGTVHEYITKSLDSFISIKDLLDYGERNIGGRDIADRYRSFEETLKHRKGYNRRSILDALRVIKEFDEKKTT